MHRKALEDKRSKFNDQRSLECINNILEPTEWKDLAKFGSLYSCNAIIIFFVLHLLTIPPSPQSGYSIPTVPPSPYPSSLSICMLSVHSVAALQ